MACKRLHASLTTLQIVFGARCALVCRHSTRFNWMLEIGTHPWSSHRILSWHLSNSKWAFLNLRRPLTWLEDILVNSNQPILGTLLHQSNDVILQCKNLQSENSFLRCCQCCTKLDASGQSVLHKAPLHIHNQVLHPWFLKQTSNLRIC